MIEVLIQQEQLEAGKVVLQCEQFIAQANALSVSNVDSAGEPSKENNLGALATFSGYVRVDNDVQALFLEHYPQLTEVKMQELAEEAAERFQLGLIKLVHRVGWMMPGDTIVFLACAASHRKQAISACDYMMDQLKTRLPFWKKERRGGEEIWVEQKVSDVEAQQAWE